MARSSPSGLPRTRLARLSPNELEVWQLGSVRLPMWVETGASPPVRPLAMLARSTRLGVVGIGPPTVPGDLLHASSILALVQLAEAPAVRCRPVRIEVRDRDLHAAVAEPLRTLGIEVERVEALPGFDETWSEISPKPPTRELPGFLAVAGASLEAVRAFAEAAAELHRAAPWNHLSDLDPILLDGPAPESGLSCCTVLGGIHPGLAFFHSLDDYRAFADAAEGAGSIEDHARWDVGFVPPWKLPVADHDLWEDARLPLGAEFAYPSPWCSASDGRARRPGPEVLAWLEGVMRALAASTPEDFDTGRWSREARTSAGAREVAFSLPEVLESPQAFVEPPDRRAVARMSDLFDEALAGGDVTTPEELQAFLEQHRTAVEDAGPRTPRELADDYAFMAVGESGWVAQKLARRAIALDPDQPEAWVRLAREASDPERSVELWKHAIAGAERRVPEIRARLRTRPRLHPDERAWIDAKAGLADEYWTMDQDDAAFAEWRDLLESNPDDHEGSRWLFVPRLLEAGEDREAADWLKRFTEDRSTMMEFSRALLAFRAHGAGPAADPVLTRAVAANRHVIRYLLTSDAFEVVRDGDYEAGSEEEAAIVADELGIAFEDTPGAEAWLRAARRREKKVREAKGRRL